MVILHAYVRINVCMSMVFTFLLSIQLKGCVISVLRSKIEPFQRQIHTGATTSQSIARLQ